MIFWSIAPMNHCTSNYSSILDGIWLNRSLNLLSYSKTNSHGSFLISFNFYMIRCLTSLVLKNVRNFFLISFLDFDWFLSKFIYQVKSLFLSKVMNWAICLFLLVILVSSHIVSQINQWCLGSSSSSNVQILGIHVWSILGGFYFD